MLELMNGIRSILEACESVKPGEKALVIAADDGKSMWIGYILMNTIKAIGAEAVLTVIPPQWNYEEEPPAPVAAAMKSVDIFFHVTDKATVVHTMARKEATALGIRYCGICQIPVEDLKVSYTAADMRLIRQRTENMAQKLNKAKIARVISPSGTDITMSLAGREAIALNPMSRIAASLPYYAEAAIAPMEGTAEGIVVADLAVSSWNNPLREPLRLTVKEGRVIDISGGKQEADALRKIAATDENANNIAELGIGTSHIVPPMIQGTRRDYARVGTAHIAIGRNNDIGGERWSRIHIDHLFSQATVELDGECVLKDGTLLI
ncbi:MAG: aminopeptidase [Chloroflexi bacterium]|nr:aminopeptidase [Chloroflexota bacterium]